MPLKGLNRKRSNVEYKKGWLLMRLALFDYK